MKHSVIALTCVSLCAAGQTFAQNNISGHLSGIESDTILVQSIQIDNNKNRSLDTIAMKNGKFAFTIDDAALKQVYILAKPSSKPNPDGSKPAMSMKAASFILFPGKPVTVTGSIDDYKVEGSDFYSEYATFTDKLKPLNQKIDSIRKHCTEMQKAGATNEEIQKAFSPARDINNEIIEIRNAYINEHPDADLSVYLLSQLPLEKLEGAMNVLTDNAKNGVMAPYYQSVKKNYDREVARKKAEEAVQPGNVAPDFTLKTIDGKDFSLSSLKGKYVVIDFWGSWCGWCIKGIPEMKKTYDKYKGKIEFVGVDSGDTEEDWKAAVKQHGLPWINVINSENPNVVALYGVRGFPTKFVIDPEGKVAKQIVGEDPEFYKYIDSIMAESK